MNAVDEKSGQKNGGVVAARSAAPQNTPCPDQLRMARANLLEALTVKFNNLFTSIVANCDMAIIGLEETNPVLGYLLAVKRAAFQASDANSRVVALIKECRETNR